MRVLPKNEMPHWLSNIETANDMKKISAKDILERSLYYPCSGRDGDPVKFLGGLMYSFVYVDNGISTNQIKISLNNSERTFKGYFVKSELCNHVCPSSIWAIMERSQEKTSDYGPDRFSFLYVTGNDVETFEKLYISNETYPDAVALIKSGWMGTDNYDRNGNLARMVLHNQYGSPHYMLESISQGEHSEASIWGEHTCKISRWVLHYDNMDLVLWAKASIEQT